MEVEVLALEVCKSILSNSDELNRLRKLSNEHYIPFSDLLAKESVMIAQSLARELGGSPMDLT